MLFQNAQVEEALDADERSRPAIRKRPPAPATTGDDRIVLRLAREALRKDPPCVRFIPRRTDSHRRPPAD